MIPYRLVRAASERALVGKACREIRLATARGVIDMRFSPAPQSRAAVIMVGGTGGGWDTPARDLYPRLAEELPSSGIAVLRVRYRDPHDLDEATFDLRASAEFLLRSGIPALALVGHSLGGAAVIRAAAQIRETRTVIALATQSQGAEAAAALGPRCSLLLIHGTADGVLPPSASESIYALAREPKELVLIPGAGHVLDEASDQVHAALGKWLRATFAAGMATRH